MKIISDKIKATTFAITKRLQGYHLLKNPKGSPATQVNMIKVFHSLSPFYDDVFNYHRISNTFINGKKKQESKSMSVVHYLDDKTAKISNKKQIRYESEDAQNGFQCYTREDLAIDEVKNRKPYAFSKKSPLKVLDSKAMFIAERKEANKARNYYRTTDDIMTKILTFGYFGNTNRPKRPNFFKVLIENFNNK